MSRHLLPESEVHESVRDHVASLNRDIVDEVHAAVRAHDVVVVGMAQNPSCKKARRFFEARDDDFRYLEYGSYLGEWRRRLALKMWTGWPTFPMVFVKGQLVGGHDDLVKLAGSGELDRLLKA
ncbi:MAG: glutaredoxin domain-containing protein [Sandaracinaceae bacterium]